jgi:hypothetical protein
MRSTRPTLRARSRLNSRKVPKEKTSNKWKEDLSEEEEDTDKGVGKAGLIEIATAALEHNAEIGHT